MIKIFYVQLQMFLLKIHTINLVLNRAYTLITGFSVLQLFKIVSPSLNLLKPYILEKAIIQYCFLQFNYHGNIILGRAVAFFA